MKKVPKIFEKASLKDLNKKQVDLLKKLAGKKIDGIYIFGKVGTGKTHMLYAFVNRMKEAYPHHYPYEIDVWNTTDLIARIKESFDNRHDNFLDQLMRFEGVLILDDIGTEKATEWVGEQFYRIINHRYENGLRTFYTSNLSPEELDEKIGERSVSRIVGSCEIVELQGDDRRLK